ncbi:hypothetical protein ACR9IZ_16965 [Klebsiella pneumoniae]|nr:hypothetical protein [Klebsiella pneumoniae]MDQ4657169.1 hypothetical protein [Klebsiella pneumoniae]
MMSLWDALRMNMMISYQELVRTFLKGIYSNSVDVNGSGEFLTESGKELIDELISELVEFVKKQKPVTAESGNE